MRTMPRKPGLFAPAVLLLGAVLGAADTLAAQDARTVGAYYHAVSEHFRVPADEVAILSEWNLSPEEMPVLLFLARHGGVSTDALVALKRGGRGWSELADRYGVGSGAFYVPLDASASGGSMSATYDRFRDLPSSRWDEVTLGDPEIVGLVNVRVLSEALHVPPARVVAAYDASGSFVAAYRALLGG